MATQNSPATPRSDAGMPMKVGLWAAQLVLFLVFIASGYTKLMTPIPALSAMMPWTGELPVGFVRFIALVDLAGGLGILLPALTRIQPRLGVLAALGIVVLQVLAIAFHTLRGEYMVLPLNFVLLPLAVFVLWGRSRKALITPR